MTILKFVNKFILQWFFIRLTKHIQLDVDNQPMVDENGNYVVNYWSLQYWIVPTTGWDKPYIILTKDRKPKFLILTFLY